MKIIKIFLLFIVYLVIHSNIHAQPLHGSYTIGSSGNYTSISTAMTALLTNGVSGNITFNIISGTYSASTIDFASGIPNQGTYDTITFTSSTNNASNVTISSSSIALTINNAKNLVVKNITLDASSGQKAVQITGAFENLEISNCNIRSIANSTPSSTNVGIYYKRNDSLSLTANNLRVIGNTIDGGYYNIYFWGQGYVNCATNIIINNNTITNTYSCGILCYYLNFNSISKNFITSRKTNTSSYFCGMNFIYCNAIKVEGNKVQTLTTAITHSSGMLFQNFNYGDTRIPVLISNNEIFIYANSNNQYGIYVLDCRANIYHNSISIGGSGVSYGLNINVSAGFQINVRNNNFHMTASAAYPIYIPKNSSGCLGTYITMDYNNYYNQTYVGYANKDITSMNDWKSVTGQDIHSLNIYPNYTDLYSYTLQTDGEDLICPRINNVLKDIRDTNRIAVTSMGAYHNYSPQIYDTKILTIYSPSKNVSAGISSPVRISIMNMGYHPIDSIDIYWEVNGITQVFRWSSTTPLALGDTTNAFTIGYFTPLTGENNIVIYTKLCNGFIDTRPLNDTVRINPFGCKSSINTVYTVGGTGADFTTITEALNALSYCGILIPTTLSINPGTYNENIIINSIKGTSTTNTLTIQSSTGDSTSVIIQSLTSDPTITFLNTNNIILKNLTIKGNPNGYFSIAIKLTKSNSNIIISNNFITTSTNTPDSIDPTNIMAIYSSYSLDITIDILNNRIVGSGGIYFKSSSNSSCSYNINIINNSLENINYYGIYSEYSRIGKIINNTIYQNPMATIFGSRGYGIFIFYNYGVTNTNIDISRNRIRGSFQVFTDLTKCINGISSENDLLFTNNILIKNGTGNTSVMLNICDGPWQCINNTFVNIGSGTVTNMVIIDEPRSTYYNFSNNILSNLTGCCTQLINWRASSGSYILDYNDYYTVNGNVAIQSKSTYSTLNLWKASQPTLNIHSKSVHPRFIDSLNNVKPTNWESLMCPRHVNVPKDKDENQRTEQTYMGCYDPLFSLDAALKEFIGPTASSTAGDTTDITVTLANYGTDTIQTITFEYSINGVIQTPITINNLSLKKFETTNIVVGFFIPTIYVSSTIKVWCKNPNNTTDQNLNNDTISVSTSGCAFVLNGHYKVGSTPGADFPNIATAISALNGCGVSGPVVLELLSGTYPGFSISNTYLGMNSTNTITFTSAAGNADSVIIQSDTTALSLSHAYHYRFTNLTFDARNGMKGIAFTDTCNNIIIKNCKIKTNDTSTSSNNFGIYKETNSFSINNIQIVNNIIVGGYTGIYLNGANSMTVQGKNSCIDSNIISNVYYRGISLTNYAHFTSISQNIITCRSSNAGYQFDGLYLYYTDVDFIDGNKIDGTLSSSISNGSGIYCYYLNCMGINISNAQITNNEIRLQNTVDAINLYEGIANICHNSIYLSGDSGTTNGIYIKPIGGSIAVKNNNIVNLSNSTNATAIKIHSLAGITLDYNNYYTLSANIAFIGYSPSYYTFSDWKKTTGQDAHSTNILPTFLYPALDLQIDGNQLLCPKFDKVPLDRYANLRRNLTNIGAYHTYTPLAFDIMPSSIVSPTEEMSIYKSFPIILTVLNRGDSDLKSFTVYWTVNGVAQTPYNWSGTPISMGNSTPPFIIDYYTPVTGNNNFIFYTSNPNGNIDGNKSNDTISIRSFACGSELSGIYTIGGSAADFDSLSTAIHALYSCGVSDNVIFKINSGTYYQDISLQSSPINTGSNYTVTFTSTANNPDSVKIISSNIALTLANARNLIFKNLTFDVCSGNIGIQFSNACKNIEISGCKILLSQNSTKSNHIGIYKGNSTGTLDYITIKNNLIDGGYYGISLYGGTYNDGFIYGTYGIIDSNTITNSYYGGIYTYYTDFSSISYNLIKNRTSNSYSGYCGLYLNHSDATINGNRIYVTNSTNYPIGMRLSYYNYDNTSDPIIIKNNEIITNANYYGYGIYIDSLYFKANIINNSILCKGGYSATFNRGIYVNYLKSNYILKIKNNNIVHESYGYPVYFGSTPNSSVLTIDYNNYYAPTYIGYINGNIASLSSWKSTTGQDAHSVSINPSFINSSIDLNLSNGNGLSCVKESDAPTDILKVNRKNHTTMGAYEVIYELGISAILQPVNGSNYCSNNTINVKVALSDFNLTGINFSSDPITFHVKISGAMNYLKDTTIYSGSINGMQIDSFVVLKNFLLVNQGCYTIKVFYNSMDNNTLNDSASVSFRVYQSYSLKDTLTLCVNELPIVYGDSIFTVGTQSGNYPIHHTLSTGCDSLITLTLKVNPTYHKYDTLTLCDNELPKTYGDSIIPVGTTTGTRYIHFTLKTGCDSLIQLFLKVNPTYNRKDTVTICSANLPYKYGDSTFKVGTVSGTYPVHFTLKTGCDSLINLTLYINPSYSYKDTVTICDNELPYKYGDSIFKVSTVSGNYPVHFTLKTGCDSLITLTLKVNPTYYKYDTLTLCDNELPRTYGDTIIPVGATSGTRYIHFTLKTGCDSLIQLFLKVNPTYSIYDTLEICENMLPINYDDSVFKIGTTSGNFVFKHILATGCDSIIYLKLIVYPVYNHKDTITLCVNDLPLYYGDSIFPLGTLSGTYPVHFTLPTSCDSLIMLTIIVNPIYSHYDTLVLCNKDLPFTYGDSILSTAGNYLIHFTAITGCDSLVYLKLYTFNCQSTDIVEICNNAIPYHYGDSTFYTSGIYQVVFHGYSGLDSLVILTLKVHGIYNLNDTITLCSNDFPYNYGDSIIPSIGNYLLNLKSIFGCDSIVHLTVKSLPFYNLYDTISICDNQLPFIYCDSTFTTSGNYDIFLSTSQGCDSTIHLKLFVFPSYNNTDSIVLFDINFPFQYGSYLFPFGTKSGIYPINFKTIHDCDSITKLKLTVIPTNYTADTIYICNNELPYTYDNQQFYSSGTYVVNLKNSLGSDSIILLTLYIYPTYLKSIYIPICNNELPYIFANNTFYDEGTYLIHLNSINGCDSIIKLFLIVKKPPIQPDTIYGIQKIIENGEYIYSVDPIENASSYIWNNTNNLWVSNINQNIYSIIIKSSGSSTLSVKAVNECGESDTTQLFISSSIGIKETEVEKSIEIYPNPAIDYFYLKTSDLKGKLNITITDVTGKTVFYQEIKINDNQKVLKINTSTFAKGFYYITILNNSKIYTKKLILE